MLLLVWIFFTLWWYYVPHRMLNVRYDVKNREVIDQKVPTIFICNHVTSTADIMIMCNEVKYFDKQTNIVAWKTRDSLLDNVCQFFKDFPMFTRYNRIDIKKGEKNDTTKLLTSVLKEKDENVLVFIHQDSQKKGIYYLAKETKCDIVLVRVYNKSFIQSGSIPDDKESFKYIINGDFLVEYQKLEYDTSKEPEVFMKDIKEKLYALPC